MFDRFLSTFSVVSRIPVKLKFTFDPSRIDFYLPVTGICPALVGFLIFGGLSLLWDNPLLTGIIVLITQYLCFNLFHLDGLMDTADAFLGTVDREKRQAILKDSRTGVYGFFAGFSVLSLKIVLLSALSPFIFRYPAVILAYPLCGRFAASLVPCMTKPANSGGLGALTRDSKPIRCVLGIVTGLLLWILLVWGLLNLAGLFISLRFDTGFLGSGASPAFFPMIFIGPLTALFYARLYGKSLGGYTGDALGAAVETGEILYLLAVYIIKN
ncbi:adenosylcobinamide-GDP ribazoletransferase [Treponema primitia]|uniref:adenosylcobinamide-GDP ribazoletransferase n=1 Tax=Treponema primitia TaxID=88058 RepID=UPI0002554F70|nr:adenosylcobinamide-GDP ribazoletransferase [Treponema primitia]